MWMFLSKLVWEHFPTNNYYFNYGPQLLFYYEIFLKTGVQVICPSEDSKSIRVLIYMVICVKKDNEELCFGL